MNGTWREYTNGLTNGSAQLNGGGLGGQLDLDITKPQTNRYTYEAVKGIADWLLARTSIRPKIGVVCGSGLGGFSNVIEDRKEFPYSEIPLFPTSTVHGHEGKLVFGRVEGVEVVCFNGRFHYYEGYNLHQVTLGVRVMKLLGVTHLLMSNAAGGLEEDYHVGDIMILKDHINFVGLAGANPLRGPNDERWGERFVSTTNMYDRRFRELAKEAAEEAGLKPHLREGVYCMVAGPSFESVAECKMIKCFGANAVGMSTVPEAIAAVHLGMSVFAFSLITNACCMEYDGASPPSHEEHLLIGKKRTPQIMKWIQIMIKEFAREITKS